MTSSGRWRYRLSHESYQSAVEMNRKIRIFLNSNCRNIMNVWRPWRVHLSVKSCAGFTLQINLTKHQQRRGLRPGSIIDITTMIEATIMPLTLHYQSMDCLQANWWPPSSVMTHHNFTMCRLLSGSRSRYRRTNEKNHCSRLSRVSAIIATSLTTLSKTRIQILTFEIRVHRPWGSRRSFLVPIFRRFLHHHAP